MHELRRADLIKPQITELWAKTGIPYSVINEPGELPLFLIGGGEALIEKAVAEEMLGEFLGPHPVVPDDYRGGFKSLDTIDPRALKRAPTPKLRMSILKRDDCRCRICGRRPDDYVDLELHVHHIRPWAKGGLTENVNLITLCHTCHNGLEPHQDLSLYEYLDPNINILNIDAHTKDLLKGINEYRALVFDLELPPGNENA